MLELDSIEVRGDGHGGARPGKVRAGYAVRFTAAVALLLLWSLTGCSRPPEQAIRSPADLKGRHIAHLSSGFHRRELEALQPDVVFEPYSEYSFAIESLRGRKIDAISLGRTYADIWMAKFPGEFSVAFEYADDCCAFLLAKGSDLTSRLNDELRKLEAEGETKRIVDKWVDAAKRGAVPSMETCASQSGTLPVCRVAAAAQAEPWCFVADGRVSGIDMDVLSVIAGRIGVRFEPKIYSWGGMVDAINGGRADVAIGGIYVAGLEFPTLDHTVAYAHEKMCLLVRNPDWKGRGGGPLALARSVRDSFVRTFLDESRWQLMARGFGLTLFITFLSALLGTALAFPVWRARTARNAVVATLARWYIAVLQGTPILVLLMVLFYIVFGSFDIDGLWVAIVGFALNASAYVGEMLRSGIDAVPRGQTEAALALGYGPRRAFFRFVLPQAVRNVLPVYRGEIVGLLKSTSIVGYIAINDLTKASDLIRSRTYESFFPVLTTAFIYFLTAWLMAFALDRLGRRLDPAGRRKT